MEQSTAKGTGRSEKGSGSQSLSRGLKLIDLLARYPNGCPLAKITEESGLNKSTAYRLLQELMVCGYVQQCQIPGSYKLTTKLLELGYHVMSSSNIFDIVSPHLNQLNLAVGETVNFSIRSDDHALLLYKLNPTSSMSRTMSRIGQYMPFYCTAMGKSFLAFDTDAQIEHYWQTHCSSFSRLTDFTILNFIDFKREIDNIRSTFVSMDNEENEIGISCLAVPIFDINYNNEYAISISATTGKLNMIGVDKIIPQLHEAAAAISRELGCSNYFKLKSN